MARLQVRRVLVVRHPRAAQQRRPAPPPVYLVDGHAALLNLQSQKEKHGSRLEGGMLALRHQPRNCA
jgi:hypothetical protein